MLGLRHHRVEHRAACIGIDLDQAGSIASDMKVITEEYAGGGARRMPCNGRRAGQYELAVCRQGDHGFDCPDESGHLPGPAVGNEYGP